jgi:hypothetical protein
LERRWNLAQQRRLGVPRHEPALVVHARDASGRLSLEKPFYGCFVPRLYNEERPHSSLGYQTPKEFPAQAASFYSAEREGSD